MSALFQRLEKMKLFSEREPRRAPEASAPTLRGWRAGRRLWRSSRCSAPSDAVVSVSLRDSDLKDLERDLRFLDRHLHDCPRPERSFHPAALQESDPYSGASPHAEIFNGALWRCGGWPPGWATS